LVEKHKKLKTLLDVSDIHLYGSAEINSKGVNFSGLELVTHETKFKLGGNIDVKKGWNLKASGPVNLDNIGSIGPSKISGIGNLGIRVRGPGSRVFIDFDADLDHVHFVDLNLGKAKGLIVWDDKAEILNFKDIQGNKDGSRYTVAGRVMFDPVARTDLNFRVKKGDIQDMIDVFDVLVRDIWWFPQSLSGRVDGAFKMTGGTDLDEMVIIGELTGADWDYFGERFEKVKLDGGYDKGKYFLKNVVATRRRGRYLGGISFHEKTEKIDWRLKTEKMVLSDFNFISRLNVPLRGAIQIDSSGKTARGKIQSKTLFALNKVFVRGVQYPQSQMLVSSKKGLLKFSGFANGGQGKVDVTYDFNPNRKSRLALIAKKLDLSPLLLLLNSKMIQVPELLTYLSGGLELSFHAGKMEYGSGKLNIDEFMLSKPGIKFELVDPVKAKLSNGNFRLDGIRLRSPERETILTLRGRNANIEGSILGNLDLGILEFLVKSNEKSSGRANLDFTISGSIKDPKIAGQAVIRAGEMKIRNLESPLENINGVLQLSRGTLAVNDLRCRLAGGSVVMGGKIRFVPYAYPILNLSMLLQNNNLKIYPFKFIKLRGGLTVTGEKMPYQVEGKIQIIDGLIREKVLNQQRTQIRKSARYLPQERDFSDLDVPFFKLGIDVKSEKGILVKNDLFDAKIMANIRVINTIDVPRLLGTADVISGKMLFRDRNFEIRAARILFDTPTAINPKFNFSADTTVKNTKISLFASGRLENWKIEFSSDPSMPEPEIISLLAMGFRSEDLRKFRAGDQTLMQQQGGVSLLLDALDFNRGVKEKTGLDIRLEDSVDADTGASIFQPQNVGQSGAAPKIVIRRKIGEKFGISVGSTVGVGSNSEKEVNAEFNVIRGVSVIGVWNTFEGVNTKDRESYGVDIKLEKKFK